jgi:hypothetical protein
VSLPGMAGPADPGCGRRRGAAMGKARVPGAGRAETLDQKALSGCNSSELQLGRGATSTRRQHPCLDENP